MAWQLFRLGRWSFVHRRAVAACWLLVLAVAGLGAATLSGKTSDKFELSGIESTRAFALIEQRAPQASPDGATARVVFEAPEGRSLTEPGYRDTVTAALNRLRTDNIQTVADPYTAGALSPDGHVGYATITYREVANELTDADRGALEDAAHAAEAAGVNVAIGGDALTETETPIAEVFGIGIALIVLAFTFGSLLAAGMPLLTAIVGVGIGLVSITTLTGFVELSSVTPALGTMLGLAVGIDYALFIMSRYRAEVRAGRTLEEAAGRAVGTAGSAVVFAGLTVIIALIGLAICGIGFLTQMGLGGAFTVGIAVLISLTLLPALLGFAGEKVVRGRTRATSGQPGAGVRTHGRRWIEFVSRHRWVALVAGVLVAAVASIPIASMQLALPDDASKPAGSDARVAYEMIAENFGAGANGPLVVVVDTAGSADPVAAVDTVTADLRNLAARPGSDIAAVLPAAANDSPQARQGLAQQLAAVRFATITVIPGSGPSDQATKDLVAEIRATAADLPARTGAHAMVTGQTAVGVDISTKLAQVFPLYLAVVVGLAIFLLVGVFRSIWVPIKAALGFLLSVGVSLGATVAVFQWGWAQQLLGLDTTSPVLFILPILLTGILFGLAMDYEVFLVSRMREAYAHGTPARRAVLDGFTHSARVVVAAAIIMVGVFAGFALTDDVILKTIGFALAVGVLADAFLVRMLIVPALMLIVGERMWFLPKRLGALVPPFDIEGSGLARRLDAPSESVADPVTAGR
ncbi:MMPL family transporter [Nocardia bovistercoris]|uniref:MMPL family transporter n=1 Tax=Nocardia bovistercoris TaxID=2785916 RepID=A0A931IBE1_9NOCA|nr:MMPL family transporter [Nocardia bovistercoris]MBH0776755.1 MMPL family transporter [Nocardia bovistercoris]